MQAKIKTNLYYICLARAGNQDIVLSYETLNLLVYLNKKFTNKQTNNMYDFNSNSPVSMAPYIRVESVNSVVPDF